MKMKTNVKAGGLTANHNETLTSDLPVKAANEFDQKTTAEIGETELETLAAALRVRSGLQAGAPYPLQPCV